MISGIILFVMAFCIGGFVSYILIRFGQLHKQWGEYMSENQIENSYFELIEKNKELKKKLKNAHQLLEDSKEENNYLFNQILKKTI